MITKERHLPLDQRREVIHVVRHVEKARLSVCREGTCMRTGILNARGRGSHGTLQLVRRL